jgi:hypothetical protein
VRPGLLVAVSLWRLAIVACSFIGFGAAVAEFSEPWEGLSQQASLLNGVVYTGLLVYPLFVGGRAHEPRSPWLRGAMAVLLMLVAVTFLTLMAASYDDTSSLFEHLVTPLLVLVDWIAVGRNQANLRWWYPFSWLIFPAAYLVYFVAADVPLYRGFLDPADGSFAGTVIGFLAALVAAGYLLCLLGRAKAYQAVAP